MELLLAYTFLYLALLSSSLFWSWPSKKDKFLEEEADRCLNKHYEIDENWSSRGHPTALSAGIDLVEKDGKKQFIKTKRLFFFE